MANASEQKKGGKLKGFLIGIIIISVVVIVGSLILLSLEPFSGTRGEEDWGTTPDGENSGAEVVADEDGVISILVVGIDDDEGRTSELTDVIIHLNYIVETGEVDILQIPRDTYINDSFPTGKINAVYANYEYKGTEGITALAEVIEDTFGIKSDHYVTITMDGFVDAVDAIGGIEIDVPANMELNGVSIQEGLHTLTGAEAEVFVRTRNIYPTGDIGRISAQRIFMGALAEKLTSMGLSDFTAGLTEVYDDIGSDLNVSEMLDLATKFREIDFYNVNMYMAPGEGHMHNSLSVYSLHEQATIDLVNEVYVRGDDEAITIEDLPLLTELSNTQDYFDNENSSLADILGLPSIEDESSSDVSEE